MTFDNTSDIIDSRDVIERIEDLEFYFSEVSEGESDYDDNSYELGILTVLAKQGSDYAEDWIYGEQLIRGTYFTEYTKEMCEDVYSIPDTWPHRCIDWEEAAEQLKEDYTAVDFNGVEYWIR